MPKKDKPNLSIVPSYLPPDLEPDHATEASARDSMFTGIVDMQEALYEHASRYRVRLKGLSKVITNLEGRVFDDKFIEDLDPRSMIKLLVLARESEKDAIEYLERLHKLVQDSQRVIKVTQTLSMTNGPYSRGEGEPSENRMDKSKMEEVRKLLIGIISSEEM